MWDIPIYFAFSVISEWLDVKKTHLQTDRKDARFTIERMELVKEESEDMSDSEQSKVTNTEDTEEHTGWCPLFILK